jgi:MSHA biogenesis protein MshE
MARPEKVRLGEILIQQGLLTVEQLDLALAEQKRTGRKLGRVFVDSGFVSEKQISEALARQLNIPFVNLAEFNIVAQLVQKLPETQARRFRAIVLEQNANGYLVGLADPSDLFAYDEISRILKQDIQLASVQESLLLQVIDKTYRLTEEITSLAQELGQNLGDNSLDFTEVAANASLEEAPVVKLLQTIFDDAVHVRASDIHIEPQEQKLQIRFRIDGVMHLQTQADMKIANALVLRLKLMSGLDISEKRLPQDGRFAIKVKSTPVDMRISTMPTQHGESVVMRLLIQNAGHFNLDKIGMPDDMLAKFKKLIHRPSGMVLVTGPTGSGKTTTLYAALNALNSHANKIITVEDPVEYRLPGINQVQVNDKIELDFARVLRSTLRQDPDIILVGEMRDEETAQTGLRAAMTGHLVLSTLHTNDAMTAPVRLIDMGAPKFMVAMSLAGVVAQRLVRVICSHCATPYSPSENELAWLALELGETTSEQTFKHGKGCNHCNHTGYDGRMGVYELLEMNNALIDAIQHQDASHFIAIARQQMQGRTLRAQSVQLVLNFRTTIAEAMRINNQFDE